LQVLAPAGGQAQELAAVRAAAARAEEQARIALK
jgi:hypothetical protein